MPHPSSIGQAVAFLSRYAPVLEAIAQAEAAGQNAEAIIAALKDALTSDHLPPPLASTSSVTLAANERDQVIRINGELGTVGAARRLGVSREAIVRAVAGLPVRRGTIAILRLSLASLASAPATAA